MKENAFVEQNFPPNFAEKPPFGKGAAKKNRIFAGWILIQWA